jgi:N-acetylneuraminic acid mutarotase
MKHLPETRHAKLSALFFLVLFPSWAGGSNDEFHHPMPESHAWETLATNGEPHARHEAAFVAFDGEFYLLGGRRVQPVSILNPETKAWREASQPPIEIHHFQPVVFEDGIYILGAMTGRFPDEKPLDKVLIYYPRKDSWEWSHSIPEDRRRGSAGAVLVDGTIYLAGGIVRGHQGGFVPWTDRYDPQTGAWERLADAPRARDHFQCAYWDGKIYAAGGRQTSRETGELFSRTLSEVDVFSIAKGQWEVLPEPLPTPRAGNSTLSWDGWVIVAGGESMAQKRAHAEVESWHVEAEKWMAWPSLQQGRHGTALILHQNYIYTCSGCGERGGRPELTSTERLSLQEFSAKTRRPSNDP